MEIPIEKLYAGFNLEEYGENQGELRRHMGLGSLDIFSPFNKDIDAITYEKLLRDLDTYFTMERQIFITRKQ